MERVRDQPDEVALRYKARGEWQDITWGDYGRTVRRAGKGLLALGCRPSEKVSLLSRNRPEWQFTDLACLSIGGVIAPVYVTNSPDQVRHVVGDSDSKIAVVENSDQLEKVLKVRSELPLLEKVVVIEGYEADADGDLVMSWEELLSAGDGVDDGRYNESVASVNPEDVATLVYTSGTGGSPKGVMLTHANIWWTATHSEQQIPLAEADGARALSYLPLSHIAERMISHLLQIYYGTQTWFAESIDSLLDDLKECKPTYFFGVPRVWEKFYAGLQTRLAEADPNDRKTKLARRAIDIGRIVTEAEQEAVRRGGKMADANLGIGTRIQHKVLDRLVLHKIRAAFGLEECRLALSAAAPLSPELIWFWHSIGLKITEGYGQSEVTGPTSWNPPEAVKIGTVGPPLPGVEVRIAADGEIMVRGGNVMPGYYNDEQANKETFDDEGWLHSGDVGELDEYNYLTVTDRKKDLIITAGGKNIAPQVIENLLKSHPLISQVVVIGDRRPFLTALITLDEEKVPAWAKRYGTASTPAALANHDPCLKEIQEAIETMNSQLAKVEGVKKFRILERDFLQEDNEVTPTLKVKRKQIGEIYGAVIEDMYNKNSPIAAGARAPERR
jgi:long-chain acyl-CoA synthetase